MTSAWCRPGELIMCQKGVDRIGKIERGQTRWPGEWRRRGFRAVLGAPSDTELGFYFHRTTPDLNGVTVRKTGSPGMSVDHFRAISRVGG
jgi:hypothetical protein